MKILVNWKTHEGRLHDALAVFSQLEDKDDQERMGAMKLLGRWHDLARGTGTAVFETECASALASYALQWNRFMDIQVSVVLDDDEAREVGRSLPSPS